MHATLITFCLSVGWSVGDTSLSPLYEINLPTSRGLFTQSKVLRSFMFSGYVYHLMVQENPALTHFRGPTIFFSYGWTSVIANKGNKRNQLEGIMN